MSTIHRAAAAGFSAKADSYARGRPDYPQAIGGWLRDELGLREGKVALELGAGTGKFTPLLAATGAQVIAVEPVRAMSDRLRAARPDIEVMEGTAEAIPLADASVNAVVCAQAFHWFATPAALAEIHRVLRPGGLLGLVWNVQDKRVDWVARLAAIVASYEGETPRYHSGEWRAAFPFAGFGPLRESRFPHEHVGPPERVIVDRILSVSFIAALPAEQSEQIASRLRELIATEPALRGKEEVTFPYETVAFSCIREATDRSG